MTLEQKEIFRESQFHQDFSIIHPLKAVTYVYEKDSTKTFKYEKQEGLEGD